jgi:hypothetical protein
MTHIHFCAHVSCVAQGTLKCGNCNRARYCSTVCQRADWEHHKAACKEASHDRLQRLLFQTISARLGVEKSYEEFLDSGHDHMEEWLEGPYGYEAARKKMLRTLFQTSSLAWSVDVYPVYREWAAGRPGNRFQKMKEFIRQW